MTITIMEAFEQGSSTKNIETKTLH